MHTFTLPQSNLIFIALLPSIELLEKIIASNTSLIFRSNSDQQKSFMTLAPGSPSPQESLSYNQSYKTLPACSVC